MPQEGTCSGMVQKLRRTVQSENLLLPRRFLPWTCRSVCRVLFLGALVRTMLGLSIGSLLFRPRQNSAPSGLGLLCLLLFTNRSGRPWLGRPELRSKHSEESLPASRHQLPLQTPSCRRRRCPCRARVYNRKTKQTLMIGEAPIAGHHPQHWCISCLTIGFPRSSSTSRPASCSCQGVGEDQLPPARERCTTLHKTDRPVLLKGCSMHEVKVAVRAMLFPLATQRAAFACGTCIPTIPLVPRFINLFLPELRIVLGYAGYAAETCQHQMWGVLGSCQSQGIAALAAHLSPAHGVATLPQAWRPCRAEKQQPGTNAKCQMICRVERGWRTEIDNKARGR